MKSANIKSHKALIKSFALDYSKASLEQIKRHLDFQSKILLDDMRTKVLLPKDLAELPATRNDFQQAAYYLGKILDAMKSE